ncbi:MAG: hypothetical protein A3F09_02150 [Chlamydiae bacterium RIFCSPHIGHO2_12_FULL_49_11]|nr:MAG: hypothetical protein A3F09_02150 [Chlamydiae bacterium RIFCSPHIGHO2_12_FULL_49_11]
MRRRRAPFGIGEESDLVNLTPLLDVIFVVLVLFIIVSPLIKTEEVHLSRTVCKSGKAPSPSAPVRIAIMEDQTVKLNGNPVALQALLKTLMQMVESDTPVQVIPDKHSYFSTFQQVKDTLTLLGVKKIEVVLHQG